MTEPEESAREESAREMFERTGWGPPLPPAPCKRTDRPPDFMQRCLQCGYLAVSHREGPRFGSPERMRALFGLR